MFYVYILQLKDDTLYTGYTKNLENRLNQHNKGVGSRYTRTRLPAKMLYSEKHPTRKDAMRREREIKKFSRKKKLDLIKSK